tara:strand:- start:456 stop:1241 length:786 start_codon:yes stop_codon:yes gene_type:complete
MLTNSVVRFEPMERAEAGAELAVAELVGGEVAPAGVPLNHFTYQGVLTDLGGQPVEGPVSLRFELLGDPIGGGARTVLTGTTVADLMPDEGGRFTVEVGLPFGDSMKHFEDFGLRVIDLSDSSPIGDEIVINPTPYAWLSEFARTADRLAEDQSHTIVLSDQFSPSLGGGRTPYATRVGNMVYLSGAMRNDFANPSGSVVGTLPVGMRPASSEILAIHVAIATESGNAGLIVTSSGQMSLISPSYSEGFTFFLNGAYFSVE